MIFYFLRSEPEGSSGPPEEREKQALEDFPWERALQLGIGKRSEFFYEKQETSKLKETRDQDIIRRFVILLVESVYSMYCIQSIHSTYTIYASVLTSVLRYNYWMLLKESILFLYVGSTLFIRLPIYPTLCYRSLATKTCLTAHSFRRRRQRRWRPEPELVYFQEIVSNLTRYLYFKISKPSILYQRGAKDRLS